MRQWRWFIAVLAGVSLGAAAQAPAGDAQRGKAAYDKNMCGACHGTAGQGTRYGPKLAPPLPAQAFDHQVRHPRAAMPRFPAEYVSDAELADVEAWLASLPQGKPAKDIPLLKE
jgi:mono/diheme cytochrome c family protein